MIGNLQMEEMDGVLSLEGLVLASEELEPYVLSFYPGPQEDGMIECFALCLMRREGGVLLALPLEALPGELRDAGNLETATGIFGPSTELEVASVILDNGTISSTGEKITVVVVDCSEQVVDYLSLPGVMDEVDYGFDADQPFALPSPEETLLKTTLWISNASQPRTAFYSAESAPPSAEEVDVTPTKRSKAKDGNGLPMGNAKGAAKQKAKGPPKRHTTASLAASMDALMQTIPNLTSQMQTLHDRQSKFEEKLAGGGPTMRSQLAMPLSSMLQTPPRTQMSEVANRLSPPPRTVAAPALGLLAPLAEKPEMIKELEGEKLVEGIPDQVSLARAVLAQSQALTTLVSQIASASSDPMGDLASSSSATGTRGAQGRARLQAELALHKGTFFTAVTQAMARRMAPTSNAEITPMEMVNRGITGTRYLERFGGYGRMREWGQIQYQIMTALDYLMEDNIGAVKDTIALLAVTLEQGVLDGGRLEIASLLCLQEDVPSGVFMNRQLTATSRSRSFSPLADQRWITCALAYLKEMDVISTKRQEFAAGGKPSLSSTSEVDPKPKVKSAPKKKWKPKGGGKEEEEA